MAAHDELEPPLIGDDGASEPYLAAARSDIRAAAERIRTHRAVLRAGETGRSTRPPNRGSGKSAECSTT